MKKLQIPTLFALVAILSLVLLSCVPAPKQEKPVFLTIAASNSLQEALLDLQKLYSKEKPNITIRYNFAVSGLLSEKIEQGSTADIYISAASKYMDALQSEGFMVPGTRKNFLRNRILLIVPKNTEAISDFKDLTSSKIKKVALAKPEIAPSGKYAQEVLRYLGILGKIKPKTVFVKDSDDVISYVATGKADAGIAFATKAILSNKIKIVAIAPENSHTPIVYSIAVLKTCKNVEEAKEFIQFLQSEPAEAVFVKYRFTVNHNTPRQ